MHTVREKGPAFEGSERYLVNRSEPFRIIFMHLFVPFSWSLTVYIYIYAQGGEV